MSSRTSGVVESGVAIGLFVLVAASGAFAKGGPKIRVADDPSLKQGSPAIVLIEISDFQ